MISSSELVLAILVVVVLIMTLWTKNEAFTLERNLPPNGDYVIVVPSFLSHSECDALVKASEEKGFVKSEVAGFRDDDPAYLDLDSRKSQQTWFYNGDHAVADAMRQRTKDFLKTKGLEESTYECEDIQVAKYHKNGYYKHHFDGDDCEIGNCPSNQRIATMLVYLKEPVSGGETDFITLKKSVKPKKGDAVFFWVADPKTRKLYKETLHAGQPVKEGVKIIGTQWIRSK
ncbi:prolyl 4-hydroxylase [Acanthocystis turfacea Chlorella virus NE-JV-3]|nr:prolyl 4-hydroxylase [Acanthocystis turfacea Chlorella virus NE-JV-3]